MGTIIQVFPPKQQGLDSEFWLASIIAVVALAGLLYMLKRPLPNLDRNRQLLIAMLLFFVTIIGGGTAFFSALSFKKVGPVTVYSEGINTPYGDLRFSAIQRMHIAANTPQSPFQKEGKRLLVIESKDKPHVLSEVNYNIDEIMRALQKAIPKKNQD